MFEHINSVFVFSIYQLSSFRSLNAFLLKFFLFNVPLNLGLAPFHLFSEVLVQGVGLTLDMKKYGRFFVWNGMEWKISLMEWNGMEKLPAMEYGRFTFHSIVCPDGEVTDISWLCFSFTNLCLLFHV